MSISVEQRGDYSKLEAYLKSIKKASIEDILNAYGQMGVDALASATPVNTGLTAASWYYEIERGQGTTSINFCNSNINDGVPIAVILQYGHGTNNGGYVQGQDYINPAIQPIFEEIANEAWKEVTSV